MSISVLRNIRNFCGNVRNVCCYTIMNKVKKTKKTNLNIEKCRETNTEQNTTFEHFQRYFFESNIFLN